MRGLQAWSCSIGYRPGWAQRTGCELRRALQAAIPAYLVAPPPFFVEMLSQNRSARAAAKTLPGSQPGQ